MNRKAWTLLIWCAMGCLVPPGVAEENAPPLVLGPSIQPGKGAPVAKVSLLADTSAITAGKPLELGIRFEIQPGWHTYWVNHGPGTGMEPSFKWKLPDGFEIGPVRFPPPRRYVDATGDTSYILEGEVVLLAELRPPAELPAGGEVDIGLEAKWLVCKDSCVLERKSLTLTLPVADEKQPALPANAELFSDARRRLPLPAHQARYLARLHAAADVNKVRPGSRFRIAVVLDIAERHHLNSHQPLQEGLIPTDLFAEKVRGAFLEDARFPAGVVKETPAGKLSLYTGRTVIILPAEADAEIDADALHFRGVVTYQACSDETYTCFPPTAAAWELTLPVARADEPVYPVNTELFAGSSTTTASGPPTTRPGFTLDTPIRRGDTVTPQRSLIVWLFFAFLAGLLLNITPCVLPVISIKIISFVQEASHSPGKVFGLGLAFSAGMMLVFNVLAVLATVAGLAWGQHFQSPIFTVVMAGVIFVFSLSLFGVFTLGVPQRVGDLSTKVEGEGYLGSLARGAFATIMGTPCVGPFLGPVLVWAASQPAAIVFLVFNTIGLGMTLPYALLSANPGWLRYVPKPGPWLVIFKQIMAFVLLAFAIRLLSVVEAQLGGRAILAAIELFTMLAVASWIIGTWLTPLASRRQRGIALLAALAVAGGGGWYTLGRVTASPAVSPTGPAASSDDEHRLPWIPFSLEALSELTAQGKTVLLDITAEWCTNCKINLKHVFHTPEVREAVTRHGVVPMLADWTHEDPQIARLIQKLAPGGSVPLCAIFPAGRPDEPVVMLGLLTRQQVIETIVRSSSSAEPGPGS